MTHCHIGIHPSIRLRWMRVKICSHKPSLPAAGSIYGWQQKDARRDLCPRGVTNTVASGLHVYGTSHALPPPNRVQSVGKSAADQHSDDLGHRDALCTLVLNATSFTQIPATKLRVCHPEADLQFCLCTVANGPLWFPCAWPLWQKGINYKSIHK